MRKSLAAAAIAAGLMGATLSPVAADSYGDATTQSQQIDRTSSAAPTARKLDEPMRIKVKNKKRKSVLTITGVTGNIRADWKLTSGRWGWRTQSVNETYRVKFDAPIRTLKVRSKDYRKVKLRPRKGVTVKTSPRLVSVYSKFGGGPASSWDSVAIADDEQFQWDTCRYVWADSLPTRVLSRTPDKVITWRLEKGEFAIRELTAAIAKVEQASGFTFQRVANSDSAAVEVKLTQDRGSMQVQGSGSWSTRFYTIVAGGVDATLGSATPYEMRVHLLMHEFGHVLGLDHVSDKRQIMYDEVFWDTPAIWGNGDLAGLAAVGASNPCRFPVGFEDSYPTERKR
jgi:hypothetical protein